MHNFTPNGVEGIQHNKIKVTLAYAQY